MRFAQQETPPLTKGQQRRNTRSVLTTIKPHSRKKGASEDSRLGPCNDIQESLQRVHSLTNNAGLLLLGEFFYGLKHKYVDFSTCHNLRAT